MSSALGITTVNVTAARNIKADLLERNLLCDYTMLSSSQHDLHSISKVTLILTAGSET